MSGAPKTFQQAIQFSRIIRTAITCWSPWPDVVKCPLSRSDKVTCLSNARLWKCYRGHPRAKLSLKVGTVFEESPLPLQRSLPALWLQRHQQL